MKVLILSNTEYHAWLYYQVQDFFREHNIHIWNDGKYPFEELHSSYDIGISFMYQYKVPAKEVNTHTWFNFHPAPLPKYKGRNLCYHAIRNHEAWFGATLHYMDENFDTGDIIDIWRFYTNKTWTAQDLSERVVEESKLMFKHFFPRILAGEEFIRLPNDGGTYYEKMPINDVVMNTSSDGHFATLVRATYYPPYYPVIDVDGIRYKIVKE